MTRSLLAVLVRLFPAAFREQFGADLLAQLERDHARAAARGRPAVLGFVLAAAADLVVSAVAERLNPTWPPAGRGGSMNDERGGEGRMRAWAQDLRLAVRSLRRTPGFTAVAVVTLGLAIGANAGIFSVVDTVLLDPLPYPSPDRLVYIGGTAPGSDLPDEFRLSAEFYVQFREASELLDDVATYSTFTNTLRVGDRVERVWMSWPTPNAFRILGVEPILGRLPTAEDDSHAVLLSYALWTTWFDRDPEVVGRTCEIFGESRTIVGVMGRDFWFPDDHVLLWGANPQDPQDLTPGRFGQPFVARLAPGATIPAVVDELTRLSRRLPERFGGSPAYARTIERFRPVVRTLREQVFGNTSSALWVLFGAVAVVLLIACANVANLFIVRGERRQRELAVRRAMGAARGQLIRAQMAEASVVAVLAGAVAMLVAWVGVPVFLRAAPAYVPRMGDVGLSVGTLLFTAGTCVLVALLCGLGPAVRASVPNLARLRESGRGATRRRHWARDGLVIGQSALALVLLIGSALLLRSFTALRHVDPGYDVKDVFTFQIAPEGDDLKDGPTYAQFHMDFMDRLAALPGVTSVGVVDNVPLDEGTSSTRFAREGAADEAGGGVLLDFTWTAGDYFGTMGIDLLEGRSFTRADQTSVHGNVILSRTAARLLWPGEDPIGRRMRRADAEPGEWFTVVGVVEDVMQYGFRDTPQPLVYLPLVGPTPRAWVIDSPAYVVKTARAATIAPEIRALVREVAPSAPMYREYTMETLAAESMDLLSFSTLTLGVVAVLALLLGTIGLYGVLSYLVAERTREIGVRMALGAEAKRVRRMVVGQGAVVVVAGAVIGAAVARASTRVLASLLFGVGAVDAPTFVGMAALMVGVGLLASYVPARRASSVDPVLSLRADGG